MGRVYSALGKIMNSGDQSSLLQVELRLPNRIPEVLTLGIYERDFIWTQGLHRCNQVKMTS